MEKRTELKARLAGVAGVDVGKILLTIMPGSVVVTATILAESGANANNLVAQVGEKLFSPAAASTLLGIVVTNTPSVIKTSAVSVVQVPAPPPKPPPTPPTPPRPSPPPLLAPPAASDSQSALVLAAASTSVGAVLLVVLAIMAGFGACIVCRRKPMPSSTPATPSSPALQSPGHCAPTPLTVQSTCRWSDTALTRSAPNSWARSPPTTLSSPPHASHLHMCVAPRPIVPSIFADGGGAPCSSMGAGVEREECNPSLTHRGMDSRSWEQSWPDGAAPSSWCNGTRSQHCVSHRSGGSPSHSSPTQQPSTTYHAHSPSPPDSRYASHDEEAALAAAEDAAAVAEAKAITDTSRRRVDSAIWRDSYGSSALPALAGNVSEQFGSAHLPFGRGSLALGPARPVLHEAGSAERVLSSHADAVAYSPPAGLPLPERDSPPPYSTRPYQLHTMEAQTTPGLGRRTMHPALEQRIAALASFPEKQILESRPYGPGGARGCGDGRLSLPGPDRTSSFSPQLCQSGSRPVLWSAPGLQQHLSSAEMSDGTLQAAIEMGIEMGMAEAAREQKSADGHRAQSWNVALDESVQFL